MEKNNRTLLQNVGGSFLIKGLSVLVSLRIMPAYLTFFRTDAALGSWFTVLSALNWLLSFDFGLGNGLRNHLARHLARNEKEAAQAYLYAGYRAVAMLCLAMAAVFLAVLPCISWTQVLHVHCVAEHVLRRAVGVGFLGILGQLFLRQIHSVLYAMQYAWINDLLGLCTSVLTVVGLRILPSGPEEQNLVMMAAVHGIASVLPLLVATAVVFSGYLCPRPGEDSRRTVRELGSVSGGFFLVQIAYMLMMNTNEYLITALSGAAAVVEYQVCGKPFFLAGSIFTLALTPVWSAVTQAAARGDHLWTLGLYRKLLMLAMGASAGMFGLLPVLEQLLNLWLGQQLTIHWSKGFWMAALGVLLIWNCALSSVANGLGRLKTQKVCFLLGAAGKLPLAMVLTEQFGSWTGVAAANVLVLLPYCLAEPAALAGYLRKREEKYE